jgi:2-dehydropantoate 2-reductase
MRALIVGVGALGGLIAARLGAAGVPAWLATRNAASAAALRASGLRLRGVGGEAAIPATHVAPLDEYLAGHHGGFDLILLATKAHDAVQVAPSLVDRLTDGGTLLPIQNGGVAQLLADRLGPCVLGGLSNYGATMHAPGAYEQRNAGHLLIGELAGRGADRASRVRDWLGRGGLDVRVTTNFAGAAWSKLLLNCSVTTLGALAGRTMRQYIATPEGRELFARTYDETLSVALATGNTPERMMVDPIPPGWQGRHVPGPAYDAWLARIVEGYGDLKPSMLQDFERGRVTEIDFINGYVADVGPRLGIPTPVNADIVETVRAISRGTLAPDPANCQRILQSRGTAAALGCFRPKVAMGCSPAGGPRLD